MTSPLRRSVPSLAAVVMLTAVGVAGCGTSPEPVSVADAGAPRPTATSAPPDGINASPGPDRPSAGKQDGCSGQQGLIIRTGTVDAAMGLRAMGFTLTNCGGRPLALNGYPDLRVLDADRKPVTPRATVSPYGKKPAPVTLLSGETARSSVIWRNTVTDPNVTATVGKYLLIAPAAGDATQTVKSGELLDLGNTGKAQVTPWVRETKAPR